MYNKVDTNLNFVEREKEIEKFWEEHDIFKKQVHQHEDADVFTFYDGPPTANGKPHIGHVFNSCNQRYDSSLSSYERS